VKRKQLKRVKSSFDLTVRRITYNGGQWKSTRGALSRDGRELYEICQWWVKLLFGRLPRSGSYEIRYEIKEKK
jgi:hypothetical protein